MSPFQVSIMTDDEIIAVVQAHKDGKKIQVQSGHFHDWETLSDRCEVQWNFGLFNYRVAPEPRKPREFWLYPLRHGLYNALDKYDEGSPGVPQIHVREVIDEGT
jgi:hypothetical protein